MIIPTFLKWLGGKRKILDKIEENIPLEFNNYYEPFLGGGSVFFYIRQKYPKKKFTISDINEDLINVYKDVRDHPKGLIRHLKNLKKAHSEKFYYKVRKSFNERKFLGIKRSAIFIYLNKTCFNGIWRVNSRNEFNVPFGYYKNPEIFNAETIMFASQLLKEVKIICQDYEEIKNNVEKGDFVYLDPCYDPIKKTSFANYTPKRFSDEDNKRMSLFITGLNNRGVYFLFSNNITKNVKKLYKIYKKNPIVTFRSVGSKGNYRNFIKEYLIKNYN